MGFSNADDFPPSDIAVLTEDNLKHATSFLSFPNSKALNSPSPIRQNRFQPSCSLSSLSNSRCSSIVARTSSVAARPSLVASHLSPLAASHLRLLLPSSVCRSCCCCRSLPVVAVVVAGCCCCHRRFQPSCTVSSLSIIYLAVSFSCRSLTIRVQGKACRSLESISLHSLFTGGNYLKTELDEVRTEWAECLQDYEGKPVIVKYVKFQNVRSLTIFIEGNQSGFEISKVQKIALYGTTVETTDMKGLKKIDEH